MENLFKTLIIYFLLLFGTKNILAQKNINTSNGSSTQYETKAITNLSSDYYDIQYVYTGTDPQVIPFDANGVLVSHNNNEKLNSLFFLSTYTALDINENYQINGDEIKLTASNTIENGYFSMLKYNSDTEVTIGKDSNWEVIFHIENYHENIVLIELKLKSNINLVVHQSAINIYSQWKINHSGGGRPYLAARNENDKVFNYFPYEASPSNNHRSPLYYEHKNRFIIGGGAYRSENPYAYFYKKNYFDTEGRYHLTSGMPFFVWNYTMHVLKGLFVTNPSKPEAVSGSKSYIRTEGKSLNIGKIWKMKTGNNLLSLQEVLDPCDVYSRKYQNFQVIPSRLFVGNRSLNEYNSNTNTYQSTESSQNCYTELNDKIIFSSSCIVDEDITFNKDVVIKDGKNVIFRGNPTFNKDLIVEEFAELEIDNNGSVRIEGTLKTETHSTVSIITKALRLYKIIGGYGGGTSHSRIAKLSIEACDLEQSLGYVDLGFDIEVEININGDLHLGEFNSSAFSTAMRSYSSESVSIYSNNTLYVHGNTEVRYQSAPFIAGKEVTFQPHFNAIEDLQLKVAGGLLTVYAAQNINMNRTKVVAEGESTINMEAIKRMNVDKVTINTGNTTPTITIPKPLTFSNTVAPTRIDIIPRIPNAPRANSSKNENNNIQTPKLITFSGGTSIEGEEVNFVNTYDDRFITTAEVVRINKGKKEGGARVTVFEDQPVANTSQNRTTLEQLANTNYRCCNITTTNYNKSNSKLVDTKNKLIVENKESSNKELSIYPNPTNDILHLKWKEHFNPSKIVLNDVYGKKVLELSIINTIKNTYTLSLKSISRGVYFLSFYDNKNNLIKTQKIMLVD